MENIEGVSKITSKNIFALIIMLWVTLLTVWVVNNLKYSNVNNGGVLTLTGIPAPAYQSQFTIQMDKDTVWIIEPNSSVLKVIHHDQNGYRLTKTIMPVTEN
jgi:hypothetical protein